jgi:hypothetical protein
MNLRKDIAGSYPSEQWFNQKMCGGITYSQDNQNQNCSHSFSFFAKDKHSKYYQEKKNPPVFEFSYKRHQKVENWVLQL